MMNHNKWLNTLPNGTNLDTYKNSKIDTEKWINTLPKVNSNNSMKKYSTVIILFVIGLVLVSVIKNQTRNLQKEINNLLASIAVTKHELYQATLDHQVITSPENISLLSKHHLEFELIAYEKNQIKYLNEKSDELTKLENSSNNKKEKKLKEQVKKEVVRRIAEKRVELKKLQELYSKPKELPNEVKKQVAKKIEEKKTQLQSLYTSPRESIDLEKIKTWGKIQIVKLFFGIPVVPGR